MRTAKLFGVSCLAICAAAISAQAQSRPQFPPTRDVTVTYHVTAKADGAPDTATLAFSSALQKLHAEGGPGAMIVDLRQRSVVVMMTQAQIAMRLPAGKEIDRILAMGGTGTVERVGSDRVAGYPCTIWKFSGKDGGGTGCITDDGVPLRGEGDGGRGHGGFEALRVSYGQQPASLFEVPPGFKQMDMAGMARGPRSNP